MKVAVIIPSRMAASRFPGKPLAKICGMPMIQHVYERCALEFGRDSVWIATCDEAIRQAGEGFGAQVVMTADTHVRCTDRVEEAARKIDADVVINVQGDEPVLDPSSLRLVLRPFEENKDCLASNLIQRIDPSVEDPKSYNLVKVVFNKKNHALYFSREAIPTGQRTDFPREYYKQLGIMAFRKDFLELFSRLAPTPYEIIESCDMMRLVEHGYTLHFVKSESRSLSVDVPADIPPVEEALRVDPVFRRYQGRA
jgi:3-deoxy-manno-octulosonate cytidylyltransferase (CMP-KDO synthetase)